MSDPIATICAMHTLADAVPHHRENAQDLVIHGQHVYRVTVERLPPDEAQDAFATFMTEGEPQWKS